MEEKKASRYNAYGLTEKQEAFCIYYIGECKGNATEAYYKAYKPKSSYDIITANASRLLNTNEKVQLRIKALREQNEAKHIATIEEIQAILTSMIQGETDEEIIVIEGTGEGHSKARTTTKKISAKDRIGAANTLLKTKGAFQPDTQLNITPVIVTGNDKLED